MSYNPQPAYETVQIRTEELTKLISGLNNNILEIAAAQIEAREIIANMGSKKSEKIYPQPVKNK